MSWLSSILIALLVAVAGAALGLLLAVRAAQWRRVTTREGYAGYWVVFWAFVAGLWSLAAALLVTRLAAFDNGFLAALSAAAAAAAGIALLALLAWLSRDRAPLLAGGPPLFAFELRAPPDSIPREADSTALYGYLSAQGAGMEAMVFDFARLRQEAGAWVLPGQVRLHTRRPGAYLAVGGTSMNNATLYVSPDLPSLLRTPQGEWTAWLPGTPSGDLTGPGGPIEIALRLRLQPPSPTSPGPAPA